MLKKLLFSLSLIGLLFLSSCTNLISEKTNDISITLGEEAASKIIDSVSRSNIVTDQSEFTVSCSFNGLDIPAKYFTVAKSKLASTSFLLDNIPFNANFNIVLEVSFNSVVIYRGESDTVFIDRSKPEKKVRIVLNEKKAIINYECFEGDFSLSDKAQLKTDYSLEDSVSLNSIAKPKKKGFAFDGWYFDEKLQNVATDFGKNNYLGDVTLYAKWNPIPDVSNITYTTDSSGKINLKWTNPNSSAFDNIVISREGAADIIINNNTTTSHTISNLVLGNELEITITIRDAAGNESLGTKINIPFYYLYSTPKILTDYVSAHAPTIAPPSTYGEKWEYMEFGVWPQSKKAASVTTSGSSSILGRTCVYGNDGYYYVQSGSEYYKLEPIKWRVLSKTYKYDSGRTLDAKLLLAENILTTQIYHTDDSKYSTSNLRSYLNHEFLSSAFSEDAKLKILTTNVDNSSRTDRTWDEVYSGYSNNCENTNDKIFTLCQTEIVNTEFGFKNINTNISVEDNKDIAKIRLPTDYAKTLLTFENLEGLWWLRSPSIYTKASARTSHNGYSWIKSNNYVDGHKFDCEVQNHAGVVPALCIANPAP